MNKEEILYQIVAVDSEFKKGFPDEITTILKNGITGKTYTDYDFKNHRYLYCFINDNFNIYDRLEEKDKEIERLKEIINENTIQVQDENGNYQECNINVIKMYNDMQDDIENLIKEKEDYKQRNEKAIEDIDLVIELIKQQPTEDDSWILNKLNGFKYILNGGDK